MKTILFGKSNCPGLGSEGSVKKARGSAGWGLRPQTPIFFVAGFELVEHAAELAAVSLGSARNLAKQLARAARL